MKAMTVALGVLGLLAGAWGCSGGPEPPAMETIASAYEEGDYGRAYEDGALRAASGASDAPVAAYLAGVSAGRLQDYAAAEALLHQAARDGDRDLAADAYASLGVVYAEQDKLSESADAFKRAAERYTGENRARSLFYGAIAQQKLGLFDQARDDLDDARAATTDPDFRAEIDEQRTVTGFTVQIVARRDRADAQRDADRVGAKTNNLRLGPPQLVTLTDPGGQSVTAVHVGRFSSHAAAQGMIERLNEPTAIVVPVADEPASGEE